MSGASVIPNHKLGPTDCHGDLHCTLCCHPIFATSPTHILLKSPLCDIYRSELWKLPLCEQSDCLVLSIRTLAAAEILPLAIPETRYFAANAHTLHWHCKTHTLHWHIFSMLPISLSLVTTPCLSSGPIHHLVNSCCHSISILSFEIRQWADAICWKWVGQVFQFVRRQFFFKLPPTHFFSVTPGHQTNPEPFARWPTFPILLSPLLWYQTFKSQHL